MSLRTQVTCLLIAGICAANVGCQTLNKTKPTTIAEKLDIPDGVPWKGKKKAKPGVPARIVATWSNAVLQRPGQGAERGFGGRLFFYGAKDVKPITVEGQLVVYAFDETGRKPTDNKPTKRYVFPAEQFVKHHSESDFGSSYSVWLPWGDAEGPPTDVSLIARFEPLQGGGIILSEQSTSRLPGMGEGPGGVGEVQIASQQLQPSIQQASHAEAASSAESTDRGVDILRSENISRERMETTSIKLPRRGRLGY